MKNPYEVLLLPEDSPTYVVNYAYRRLARRWHPDFNPNNREDAEKRMKEINAAYETIKKASAIDPRWNYLDYEFKDPGREFDGLKDILAEMSDYSATAELDCYCAMIHRVARRKSRNSFDIGALVSETRRSDFYLNANPDVFEFRADVKIELEDLLIAATRKKGSKLHPLYVRPTLRYYGIEPVIEPRIIEFCEMLSQPGANSSDIIKHFDLSEALFKYGKKSFMKTLEEFGTQLDLWINPYFNIEETPKGEINISYFLENGKKEEFELSRKDYIFIQCLVFGNRLLEQ